MKGIYRKVIEQIDAISTKRKSI